MKRLFLRFAVFITLLVPGLAFAQNPTAQNSVNQLATYNIFKPSITDKSVDYLGQIFGNVGSVVSGNTSQLLGELFRVFNFAMVIVASCILIYTVFMAVINTAQEGEFMGRKMNSIWVIVRAVAGIGILVPKYTGYSLVQVFVMWVAVQGIGLADKTWNVALDYVSNGSAIYSDPVLQVSEMRTVFDQSSNVLGSEVCMYKLQDIARQQRDQSLLALRQDPSNQLLQSQAKTLIPAYNPVWDDTKNSVSFGSPDKTLPDKSAICGQYQWATSNTPESSKIYMRTGLEQMVTNLMPVAKSIVSTEAMLASQNKSLTDAERKQIKFNLSQRIIDGLLNTTADYETIMAPALTQARGGADVIIKKNLQDAKDQGWIMAGSYYWDLARANGKATELLNNYAPKGSSVQKESLKKAGVKADEVMSAVNFGEGLANVSQVGSYLTLINSKVGQLVSPQEKVDFVKTAFSTSNPMSYEAYTAAVNGSPMAKRANASLVKSTAVSSRFEGQVRGWEGLTGFWVGFGAITLASPGVGIALLSLMGGIQAAIDSWFTHMNAGGDPILNLQLFGQSLVNIAMVMWIAGAAVLGLATTLASIMGSVTGLGFGIQNGLKLFLPIVVAIIAAFFVNGIVLSVYVPLIPFMIFAFAAIGWMISVLEAMVAAPLVAAAITHPEGHDLLGKAEQAVMLLMGVFLRPVVMIIGFLAAIILARVGLKFINTGFSYAVSSADIVKGMSTLFTGIGIMVIYTVVVVSLINMVFNAGIVKLWETIWMWVGFHQPSTGVEQALGEIKGGAHGAGQAMSSGAGNLIEGGAKHDNKDDPLTKGASKLTGKKDLQVGDSGGGGKPPVDPSGGGGP